MELVQQLRNAALTSQITLLAFLLPLSFIWASSSGGREFTVTTISDAGAGSLREAIINANATGSGTLTFSNITGAISLATPLPPVTADISITGPENSLVTISGNNTSTIFLVSSGATVVARGLAIVDAQTSTNSGAAFVNRGDLTLTNCVIANCRAFRGGGIDNSGNVRLQDVRLSGNQTQTQGGAVFTSAGTVTISNCSFFSNSVFGAFGNALNCRLPASGGDAIGGAMSIGGGEVTIFGSTFSRNTAYGGGGSGSCDPGFGGASGGAASGGAIAVSSGMVKIINSTISENQAVGGPGGLYPFGRGCYGGRGGLARGSGLYSGENVLLMNVTVAFNSGRHGRHGDDSCNWGAPAPAEGGIYGAVTLWNTLVASNNPGYFFGSSDLRGTVHSRGFNLIGNSYGMGGLLSTDLRDVDAQLAPLANNGGTTATHALLPGSPAIDAGGTSDALTDQRGRRRTVNIPTLPNAVGGDGTDIGALETDNYIVTVQRIGPDVRLKFNVFSNDTYHVEYTTVLPATNWSLLSGGLVGSGETLFVTNFGAAIHPQRFYRVRQDPWK